MIKISKQNCPDQSKLRSSYKHPIIKAAVIEDSHGKCIYCESKVTDVYFGDIEHIKPKSKYPELEKDWENLGFVCAICNSNKGDKYDEDLPFINPYSEDPDNFLIALGPMIYHAGKRGEVTIRAIGLNRPELVETRREHLDKIQNLISRYKEETNDTLKSILFDEIHEQINEAKEYCFCANSLARALIGGN